MESAARFRGLHANLFLVSVHFPDFMLLADDGLFAFLANPNIMFAIPLYS